MAPPLRTTSVAEIERRLARAARGRGERAELRTSVLTHIAWVPPRVGAAGASACSRAWRSAHPVADDPAPSRPAASPTGSTRESRTSASRLGGGARSAPSWSSSAARRDGGGARERRRAAADPRPAGLPRWRGRPPFGTPSFEQLVGVHDRLIVDSTRVGRPAAPAYARASRSSSTASPSPTSPGRGRSRWRAALADLWPVRRRSGSTCAARAPTRSLLQAGFAPGSKHDVTLEPRRCATSCARSRSTASPSVRRRAHALAERPALRRARGLRPRPDLRGRGQIGVTDGPAAA